MPKRILAIAFAVGALALAACNNGNPNNLYGSATPTPSATPSPSPNPSASTATVTVTYSNSPIPNQPVSVSTPDSTGNFSVSGIITTINTNSSGVATFSNLTPAKTYCWASTYTPAAPGSLARTGYTGCTNLWGWTGLSIAF